MSGPSTAAWTDLAQKTLDVLLNAERVRRHQATLTHPAGVNAAQIALAERQLHSLLPDELIALYRLADGGCNLSPGPWLKLQTLVMQHEAIGFRAHMLGLHHEVDQGDSPSRVRHCPWHPGWLPVAQRRHGPQSFWLCVDTAPGSQGQYGQLIEVPCIRYGMPPAGLSPRWVAPSLLAYLVGVRSCLRQHRRHARTREAVREVSGTEHGWHWVEQVLGGFTELPAPPPRAAIVRTVPPTPSQADIDAALLDLRRPSTGTSECVDLHERVHVHDVRFLADPPERFSTWGQGTREKASSLGPVLQAWAKGRFSPRVVLLLPAAVRQRPVVDAMIQSRLRREGASPCAWLRIDARDHLEALHAQEATLESLADLLAAEARRRQVPSLAGAWLSALQHGQLNLVVLHGEALWLAQSHDVQWGADLPFNDKSLECGRVLWLMSQQALDKAADVLHLLHALSAWTLTGPTRATALWCDAQSAHWPDDSVTQSLQPFGLAEDAEALALWQAQAELEASDKLEQAFPKLWLQHLLQRVLPQQRAALVKLASAVKKTLMDKASSVQLEEDVSELVMKRVSVAVSRWPAPQQRQARYIVRRWLGLQCQDEQWIYGGEPWWRIDPVPALLAAMVANNDDGVCAALQGPIDLREIQHTVIDRWQALGHTTPYTGTARLLTQAHHPRLTGRLLALASSMAEMGYASQGDFPSHVRAQQRLTLPEPPHTALLAGADLTYVSLHGLSLVGVDLSSAVLEYAGFRQVDLSHANLTGLTGQGCSFVSCCLRGAKMDQSDLTQAYFTGSDLRDLSFNGLRAADSDWTDAQWNQLLGSSVVRGARGTYHGVTPATHSAPKAPISLARWPEANAHLLRACPRGQHLVVAFPGGELFAAEPDTLQARWGWWLPDGPVEQLWMHDDADMFISVHDAKAPPLTWNTQTGRNFHRMSRDSRESGAFASVGLEHPCWRSIEPIRRHPGWLFTSGYQSKSIELVQAENVLQCSTAPSYIAGPGKLKCFATWCAHDLVVWCTDDRIEVTPLTNPTGSSSKVSWAPITAHAVYALELDGKLMLIVLDDTGLLWGDIAAEHASGAVPWSSMPESARHARRHFSPGSHWLLLEGPGLTPTLVNLNSADLTPVAAALVPGTPATLLPHGVVVWERHGLKRIELPADSSAMA
jgi:cell wall assembly regulator SMI1